MLAIQGRSGSGKTTLLNIMGLLDSPTEGRVFVAGQDVTVAPERRRAALRSAHIGFVFQQFHLIPHRTAFENVALAHVYGAGTVSDPTAATHEALIRLGLKHRIDARVGTLSGGEKQRVAIARAVTRQPDLILCDEPTGNLDSLSAEAVADLLVELNDRGFAVVLVTHDSALASVATRQAFIADGRLEVRQ
jgi:putative ABC transport system ATP-binding protein